MKSGVTVGIIFLLAASLLAAAGQTSASALAYTNLIWRASVSSAGAQANNGSDIDSISPNGRFVVFNSVATNLAAGGTAAQRHVYLRDLRTGLTELVSVNSDEVPANADSSHGHASDTGRYVVFQSTATNLVPGDISRDDIFLRDRQLGTTIRISTGLGGVQPNGDSYEPSMSPSGGAIVFQSAATNLIAVDTNNAVDIFLYLREAGTLERISLSSEEAAGNGDSAGATISEDGRFVAFSSSANNLVSGDTNNYVDVFVRDLQEGDTERVSISTAGTQQSGCSSQEAAISANGRAVVFSSVCAQLVTGDTNNVDDLFVRDLDLDSTERVNLSNSEVEANGYSSRGAISYDGRYVSFQSHATNLVSVDRYSKQDVFLRDRQAGTTILISTSPTGLQGNDGSYGASMSADACYIAFGSDATNLISTDTNTQEDVYVYGRIPCAWQYFYLPVVLR